MSAIYFLLIGIYLAQIAVVVILFRVDRRLQRGLDKPDVSFEAEPDIFRGYQVSREETGWIKP